MFVVSTVKGWHSIKRRANETTHFHLTTNIQKTQHSRKQLSFVCYFIRYFPVLVTLSHNNPNNKISC